MERSCELLKEWGLEPVMGKYVLGSVVRDSKGNKLSTYAGTLEQRVEDLRWALEDDSIKAILCSRGGYGAIQLLDQIPLSTYLEHPKWIAGFSDITTLLSASTVAGVMSIHGNNAVAFAEEDGGDIYSQTLRDILFGKIPSYHVEPNKNDVPGHAEGMLVGGNMITMEALFGTEYDFTQYDGIILLIEEVEESYQALDRFLNSLALHGRIPNIKGIIVGNMRHCEKDMPYEDAYELIGEYAKKWNIPTTFGLKCGHGPDNYPLVIGATVTVDITENGSEITMNLD
ncbi:MAG: LD-carboxypeptidase [Bacteroidales bacterium]|nr:LD-carboxypeptidase [Bacteroidales bacterium]